jgi:Flp pilus assembly pilin Flp
MQNMNEEGSGAAEYGAILAGIAVVIAIAATVLGGKIAPLIGSPIYGASCAMLRG